MNAILKNAIETFEKLSPEDQKTLAAEIERRAHELWLDAELAKGEASLEAEGTIPLDDVFDPLKRKYGG